MIDFTRKERYGFDDLVELIRLLRTPEGCPWDREQTHASIRRNFLEETYEALEAIDEDDPVHLCEELGDVLMQVVFHGEIEREAGRFTLDDVCDGVCRKLILRHPHVFGSVEVSGSGQVLENWEAIKRREKKQESWTDTLRAVSRTLPATWRAEKLQKKAGKAGLRPDGPAGAAETENLSEKAAALREAAARGAGAETEEALGEALFAAVGVAAALKIDPEAALQSASERFIQRFSIVEALAAKSGGALDTLPREQLARLWQTAGEDDNHSHSL